MKSSYKELVKIERHSFIGLVVIIVAYATLLLALFQAVKVHYSIELYNSLYLLGIQCMDFARNLLLARLGSSSIHVIVLAAALIFLFRGITIAIINQVRTYSFVKSLETAGFNGRYFRIRSDDPLAFTYGLFNPKIYISDWYLEKLTKDEIEAVILHEESHINSKDNLKKSLLRLFQFSLPGLSTRIIRELNWEKISEAKADAHVVERLGSNQPLLSAMLKVSNSTFKFNSKFSLNYFFEDSNVGRVDFLTDIISLKVNYRKLLLFAFLPLLMVWFIYAERSLVFSASDNSEGHVVNMVPGTCTDTVLPGYKSDDKPFSPIINQSFR
ncbi:MAG: M48 family metalloprotease [Candidatus Dojkabacteria bacterium]|nr:MAG: M48 family metalloprotease [Candidatus Dojkabacteria bacterium]